MDTFATLKGSLKDSFNGITFYSKKQGKFEQIQPYYIMQMIMTKDLDTDFLSDVFYTAREVNSPALLSDLFNKSDDSDEFIYKEGGSVVWQGTKSGLNHLKDTMGSFSSVAKLHPITADLDSLTELHFDTPTLEKFLKVFKGQGVLIREFLGENTDDATSTFIKTGETIRLLTEVSDSSLLSYWVIPVREDIPLEEKQKSSNYVIGEIIFMNDDNEPSEPMLFESRLNNLRSYQQFSPFDSGSGVLTNIVFPLRDPQFSLKGLEEMYSLLVDEIVKSNNEIIDLLHK